MLHQSGSSFQGFSQGIPICNRGHLVGYGSFKAELFCHAVAIDSEQIHNEHPGAKRGGVDTLGDSLETLQIRCEDVSVARQPV